MNIYENENPRFNRVEYLHEVVLSEFNWILAKICRIDVAVCLKSFDLYTFLLKGCFNVFLTYSALL